MTLARINDKPIKDIQVYRHEWSTDRAIAEPDRLNFAKLLNFYYIHNKTWLRATRYELRVECRILQNSQPATRNATPHHVTRNP